ncbi:unnamed protein product [Closterium sp. NIES-64]|nr:unnamed protein product [Closterium sp. NIES-64]
MSAASATAAFPSLDGSPQLRRAPFQSLLVKSGSGSQRQSHLILRHSVPCGRITHPDRPNAPVHLNPLPRLALYSRPRRAVRAAAAPTPVVSATAAAPRGGRDGEYDRTDQWDDTRARRSEDYEDDYNEDFFASDVALPPGARFGKRDQPDESWINDSDWSRGSAGPRKTGQGGEGEGSRGRRQQGDRGGLQGSRGGRSGRDGESAGAGRGRMRGSAGGGDGWGELEEAEGAAERRRVLEEQGIAQQRRGLGFKGGRGGYGGGETGRFGAGEARERSGAGREETRLAQGSGFRREREGLPEGRREETRLAPGSGFRREREGLPEGRREERSEMGVRREAREEGWKAAGEQRGYGREGRGGGWVGDRRVGGKEEDGEEGESRSRGSSGGSRGSRGVSRRQWGEYGEEEDRGERGTRSFGVAAAAAAAAAAAGATAAATAAAGASLLPLTAAAPSSPALPSAPSPSRSPSPPLSTFPSPSPSLSPSLSASPSTSPSASPTSSRAPKLKLARPRGVPSPGKPGEGVRPGVPVCYGCGAELQTRVEDAPGYIPPDRYEMTRVEDAPGYIPPDRYESVSPVEGLLSRLKRLSEHREGRGRGGREDGCAGVVCYGCGGELQTRVEDAPGYIPPDRCEMSRVEEALSEAAWRHKQLRSLVCTHALPATLQRSRTSSQPSQATAPLQNPNDPKLLLLPLPPPTPFSLLPEKTPQAAAVARVRALPAALPRPHGGSRHGPRQHLRDPKLLLLSPEPPPLPPCPLSQKKRHTQLRSLVCTRCQQLSHGRMVPPSVDFESTQKSAVPRPHVALSRVHALPAALSRSHSGSQPSRATAAPKQTKTPLPGQPPTSPFSQKKRHKQLCSLVCTRCQQLSHSRMKKRHKQLRSLVCTRCQQLSHGRMVAAVTGHGGYRVTGPADMFVTAEALRQQLTYVRGEKALVVKLVDLVDFSGSFLSRIRDIVGPNPIVLVITKVDLVPEGTHMDPVADWVLAAVAKKKLNVLAVHFVSAKARTGLSSVAATIQRERQGRDVYVLGAANVGKSAFICALLDEMASRDIMAAAARRRRPVASAMPGTTLGPICLKAFSGGGDLYDTPGVHLHHRMAAMLHPWDLHHLGPKRRLRSFVVTGPLEQHTGAGKGREKTEEKAEKAERGEKGEKGEQKESVEEAGGEARAEEGTSGEQKGLQGTSLFWGGLVRIDVVKAPAGTALTFFGPVAIRVSTVPTPAANAFYEAEVGRLLVPPSKPLEEPAWEGLPSQRAFSFRLPAKRSSPVADIAISGLGWVSLSGVKSRQRTNPDADVSSSDATTSSHAGHVEPTGSWDDPDAANDARGGITRFEGPGNQTPGMGYNDEDGHGSSGLFGKQESDVEVVVHVPKGIEVFVRPPMPVGWFANDWYQYEELSEKEEMSRPRVFHDEA